MGLSRETVRNYACAQGIPVRAPRRRQQEPSQLSDFLAELRWSTGPIEGHITRVKFIKRLGYGRAGLNLLRARITGVA
jgi:transposase